jgi:hypothetical protein
LLRTSCGNLSWRGTGFNKKIFNLEKDEICNSIFEHIIKIENVFSNIIIENAIGYFKNNFGKNFDDTINDYNNFIIIAYSVVSIGSYLNGQRILKGNEWNTLIECIKTKISSKYEFNLNKLIEYINSYEYNRMEQAARVIREHLLQFDNFEQLPIDNQSDLCSYLVPLLELMSIYITLMVDLKMNNKQIKKKANLLFEYENRAKLTYIIDIDQLHEIFQFL